MAIEPVRCFSHRRRRPTGPWLQQRLFCAQGDPTSLESFRYRDFLFTVKDSRGSKQGDMRKCLWQISQLSFLAWIVLLGEKSQVVSHVEQALEQFARFFLSVE